jgi:site-specific DNA-methyltransferase (adenine-specific)
VSTKFFRFLVLLIKSTQDAASKVYSFVPIQNFNEEWTDEKLYQKYDISSEEIEFIDSLIRPMDLSQNVADDE